MSDFAKIMSPGASSEHKPKYHYKFKRITLKFKICVQFSLHLKQELFIFKYFRHLSVTVITRVTL